MTYNYETEKQNLYTDEGQRRATEASGVRRILFLLINKFPQENET